MADMASPEYVTSTVAKTLYCPYWQNICKGSECMLWRWTTKDNPTDAEIGYCGLAQPDKGPLLSQFPIE